MNLIFEKTLMQRYRSVACIADSLIEDGHKLYIKVSSDNFDFRSSQKIAGDVSNSSKESFLHLIRVFGLKCDHINEINFVKKGDRISNGIFILNDDKVCKSGYFTIPYNEYYCRSSYSNAVELVGNPMCELINNERSTHKYKEGTLLLLHSGGMRGDVSPRDGKIKPDMIIENNNKVLGELFSYLPKRIREVTIKTHPMPHINCDTKALIAHNLPFLQKLYPDIRISICGDNLLSLLASHEFIVNFGGSTSLWVMGSDLKWINVRGFSMYPYAKLRENKSRSENWEEWPQNIYKSELKMTIENYEELVINQGKTETMLKYTRINKMPSIKNIIEFIRKNIK